MIRFSTDDIPPEDRFDQWREVRGKSLFGVTIELPPDRRHTFKGSFRAQAVGGAARQPISPASPATACASPIR